MILSNNYSNKFRFKIYLYFNYIVFFLILNVYFCVYIVLSLQHMWDNLSHSFTTLINTDFPSTYVELSVIIKFVFN